MSRLIEDERVERSCHDHFCGLSSPSLSVLGPLEGQSPTVDGEFERCLPTEVGHGHVCLAPSDSRERS